jgi:hypothetical protein
MAQKTENSIQLCRYAYPHTYVHIQGCYIYSKYVRRKKRNVKKASKKIKEKEKGKGEKKEKKNPLLIFFSLPPLQDGVELKHVNHSFKALVK